MAEAKQEDASSRGTGLFDYEMLQSLQSIQGGISDLKNIIKKQEEKPYEEARERLKLNLPTAKAPRLPGLPRIPDMLPSMAGITDFATRLAKYALLGTFLLGLLKETIGKYFDSIEFDSTTLGGLIGGALKDLMTQQPGEDSLLDRFKAAFVKGDAITGALAGATIGILGGPIGIVAGAIIGLVGGVLYSLLGTDTGADAKALKDKIDAAVKGVTPWAAVGGVLGGIVFRTPSGAIAGAILGTALYMIKKAMDPMISDDPEAEAKRLTEDMGGKTFGSKLRAATQTFMSNMLGSLHNSVIDAYGSVMKMIHRDNPQKLAEIEKNLQELKVGVLSDEETTKKNQLLRQLQIAEMAKMEFEQQASLGRYEGIPATSDASHPDMKYEDQVREQFKNEIMRIERELEKITGTKSDNPGALDQIIKDRVDIRDGFFHKDTSSINEKRIASHLRNFPLHNRVDFLMNNEAILQKAIEEHGSLEKALRPMSADNSQALSIVGQVNRAGAEQVYKAPIIISQGDTTNNAVAGSGNGGGTEVVEKEPSFLGFSVNDLNWNYFGRIMSSGR